MCIVSVLCLSLVAAAIGQNWLDVAFLDTEFSDYSIASSVLFFKNFISKSVLDSQIPLRIKIEFLFQENAQCLKIAPKVPFNIVSEDKNSLKMPKWVNFADFLKT